MAFGASPTPSLISNSTTSAASPPSSPPNVPFAMFTDPIPMGNDFFMFDPPLASLGFTSPRSITRPAGLALSHYSASVDSGLHQRPRSTKRRRKFKLKDSHHQHYSNSSSQFPVTPPSRSQPQSPPQSSYTDSPLSIPDGPPPLLQQHSVPITLGAYPNVSPYSASPNHSPIPGSPYATVFIPPMRPKTKNHLRSSTNSSSSGRTVTITRRNRSVDKRHRAVSDTLQQQKSANASPHLKKRADSDRAFVACMPPPSDRIGSPRDFLPSPRSLIGSPRGSPRDLVSPRDAMRQRGSSRGKRRVRPLYESRYEGPASSRRTPFLRKKRGVPSSSHHHWIHYQEKTESARRVIEESLKEEFLFQELPSHLIPQVIDEMYRVQIPAGSFIFQQGEVLDAFFIVESGGVNIFQNREGENVHLMTYGPGESIGAEALIFENERYVSAQAIEECVIWALDKDAYMKIRDQSSNEKSLNIARIAEFLSHVPLLQSFPRDQLEIVAYAVKNAVYDAGDAIVRQGEKSRHFFIVNAGRAVARRAMEGNDLMWLAEYGPGDYFGELGILENKERSATVVADEDDTSCFVIKADDFRRFLAPQLQEPLQTRLNSYELAVERKTEERTGEEDYSDGDATFVSCGLDDFENLGMLGVGSFGRVSLVKDPRTSQTYSLKKIRKNRVIETGQHEHIVNEKNILKAIHSDFCVRLMGIYQDELNVYFLTEAILGGDLWRVLRHNKRFPEKTAAFYAGCVVLAFEYLHHRNIIYRDIKTENLMITWNGYVKLVDFGFAKVKNHTTTLCGTPEYMAPEVYRGWAQGFAVDWWGLGVLIYEMVVGRTPFQEDRFMALHEKILTSPVKYPSHVSQNFRDIIDQLLRKNAYQRLGTGFGGPNNVKKHPWFKKIDFEKLSKQQLEAPYCPKIQNNEDRSSFDEVADENIHEELLPDPTGELFKWCSEF